MPQRLRSPKERAARALCDMHGRPPDNKMGGQPTWVSYLPEADAVLSAAMPRQDWIQREEHGAVDQ
ncbi:hypothetical protein GCM10007921_40850 [Tritonibacter mobilis]|nr:hypothetical protein GCM10007921_40850 [Tritonibacter mobilis]